MKTAVPYSAARRRAAGFTMMEIAICLAIIGIALVAIVGVLPYGLHAQRDNREESIIGADASVLLDAIRSGAHGQDDLTNYVISITNVQSYYAGAKSPPTTNYYGFTFGSVSGASSVLMLTNGANIVGIMSTPEYVDLYFNPTNKIQGTNDLFLYGGYLNHILAYFYSLSGPAVEKPPQTNSFVREGSLGYRIIAVNAPVALGDYGNMYARQIAQNQRELRLTFTWPLLPTGVIGPSPNGSVTFRATIPGQLQADPLSPLGGRYFYRPQYFIKDTNAP